MSIGARPAGQDRAADTSKEAPRDAGASAPSAPATVRVTARDGRHRAPDLRDAQRRVRTGSFAILSGWAVGGSQPAHGARWTSASSDMVRRVQ